MRAAPRAIALLLVVGLGATLVGHPTAARGAAPAPRWVTIGGAVTETVFALGAGAQVAGVDITSGHPTQAAALPKVGFYRQLATEGILSLAPERVLAIEEAGPPPVLAQLQRQGVGVTLFPLKLTLAGALARLRAIAAAIGRVAEGEALATQVEREVMQVQRALAGVTRRPRALYIYSRGSRLLLVGGRNTPAHAMIELAHGHNVAGGVEGFKPLSPEVALAGQPEVVLISHGGLAALGGPAGLWRQPGLAGTPAAAAGRVITFDDQLLLTMGPRLGTALRTLALQLHPGQPGL